MTQQTHPECEAIFKFFDVKPKTNGTCLKSHKQFVAESICLLPKLFSDVEAKRRLIIEYWKHNVFGEHLDKEIQKHFFETIYPQLNTLNALKKLALLSKQVLIIAGVDDYVTPWPEEIASQLKEFENIRI